MVWIGETSLNSTLQLDSKLAMLLVQYQACIIDQQLAIGW